ncbi:hypothetical protein EDM59_21065 [Brevibacillus nitrificans]|uniref:Uncharacterized protein n=1 Tax=Brevibacillus nitrificans TaxID=651560 RepID=A0A3M8D201_9BACL|nr:hypothetical protein [Brevibacillus nitrificans]RNB82104.1 hypothetical protein EDM59_21065 [Brevibacillus nitrificans]
MEEKGVWAEPEDFFSVFRCTTQKYAETFLKKGEIKFSTPSSWVKYAFEKGEGRGDKLEGTMATFHAFDIEHLTKLNQKYRKYSDLERIRIGQRIYLKRARDMELPCFCFYLVKQSLFDCPNEEGVHRVTGTVPASYFRDFMDNLDPKEVEKLDQKDKPAVIVINDYKEFEQRIINALMALGLNREEIIITRVAYIDFDKYGEHGWWDFGQKSPMELTIKHTRFENQSEGRIIINTDNERITQILGKPIEIGSLEDIATVSNTYLHEGMSIEATVDLYSLD